MNDWSRGLNRPMLIGRLGWEVSGNAAGPAEGEGADAEFHFLHGGDGDEFPFGGMATKRHNNSGRGENFPAPIGAHISRYLKEIFAVLKTF